MGRTLTCRTTVPGLCLVLLSLCTLVLGTGWLLTRFRVQELEHKMQQLAIHAGVSHVVIEGKDKQTGAAVRLDETVLPPRDPSSLDPLAIGFRSTRDGVEVTWVGVKPARVGVSATSYELEWVTVGRDSPARIVVPLKKARGKEGAGTGSASDN